MDGKPNGTGFGYKDLTLGGRTYRLFSQETSYPYSPAGRTFVWRISSSGRARH